MVSISELSATSLQDRLAEYAKSIPDGQCVALADASEEIGCSATAAMRAAKRAGICLQAWTEREAGSRNIQFIANPKTVKLWQAKQKQNPAK